MAEEIGLLAKLKPEVDEREAEQQKRDLDRTFDDITINPEFDLGDMKAAREDVISGLGSEIEMSAKDPWRVHRQKNRLQDRAAEVKPSRGEQIRERGSEVASKAGGVAKEGGKFAAHFGAARLLSKMGLPVNVPTTDLPGMPDLGGGGGGGGGSGRRTGSAGDFNPQAGSDGGASGSPQSSGGTQGSATGTTADDPQDSVGVLQSQLSVQEEILAILQRWEDDSGFGEDGDGQGRIRSRLPGGGGGLGAGLALGGGALAGAGVGLATIGDDLADEVVDSVDAIDISAGDLIGTAAAIGAGPLIDSAAKITPDHVISEQADILPEHLTEPFTAWEAQHLTEPFTDWAAEHITEPFVDWTAEKITEPFTNWEPEHITEAFSAWEADHIVEPFTELGAADLVPDPLGAQEVLDHVFPSGETDGSAESGDGTSPGILAALGIGAAGAAGAAYGAFGGSGGPSLPGGGGPGAGGPASTAAAPFAVPAMALSQLQERRQDSQTEPEDEQSILDRILPDLGRGNQMALAGPSGGPGEAAMEGVTNVAAEQLREEAGAEVDLDINQTFEVDPSDLSNIERRMERKLEEGLQDLERRMGDRVGSGVYR